MVNMPEVRRAFVTGATGYIGSRLLPGLVDSGWEVHALHRGEPGVCGDALHWHKLGPGFTGLAEAIREANPDVVFHLGALYIKDHRANDLGPLIDSNVRFTAELCEAMGDCGVSRLVAVGTAWQHGEGGEYEPATLYAATKQAAWSIMEYYQKSGALRVTHLHLFDTFGPRDPRPKIFNLLSKVASTGETLQMSPGGQVVDPVYVGDVVDALCAAGTLCLDSDNVVGRVFGVSGGSPMSLKELVALWSEATGLFPRIDWGAKPYREREVMRPWRDPPWLPGWEPKTDRAEAFRLAFTTEGRSCESGDNPSKLGEK